MILLRRLDGKQINHQIFLKFSDELFSNKGLFGNEKTPYILTLEFDYFVIFLIRDFRVTYPL